MGKIKKLHFDEINKHPSMGEEELYPITHTDAIYDDEGHTLTEIIQSIKASLRTIETTDEMIAGNKLAISSGGVYTQVGNIELLLKTV